MSTCVSCLVSVGRQVADIAVLIHSPFFAAPLGLKRTWEAMEALRDEGLCKSIGVSNFREEDLLELSESWKVPPAVNQVSQACAHPA